MTVLASLGSGHYRNMDWRVERHSDADFPVLTFEGNHGPRWITKTVEIEGCSPAKVKHWINAALTAADLAEKRKRA